MTLPDGGSPIALVLAQRGQPRRAAGGRRRRPRREGLRLPPQQRDRRRRLALQRGRPGGLLAVGRADLARRHRHGLRRQRRRPPTPRAAATRPSPTRRRRPVVRPGDQPGHRPDAALGSRGLADRRRLRRRLRRRGRLARPEHVRAGRRQRRHAGRVPVVPGRLGVLDRGGGRPLRRRQQRDHQRRRLQRRHRLRADLRQRRAHPHPLERGQRRVRPTRPAASSASTTRTRTSTARRRPSASSWPAAASASPIGDGSYYSGASDSNKVFAINTSCGLAWSDALNGVTADSPALANVQGNGSSTSSRGPQANTIYVLNGTNGGVVWSASTTGQVIGSPVTADLTGGGYQDVIVPTTDGIDIFDGRSGSRGGDARHRTTASRTRRSSPTTPTATSASRAPAT